VGNEDGETTRYSRLTYIVAATVNNASIVAASMRELPFMPSTLRDVFYECNCYGQLLPNMGDTSDRSSALIVPSRLISACGSLPP